jgi:hypothetical protein
MEFKILTRKDIRKAAKLYDEMIAKADYMKKKFGRNANGIYKSS